MKRNVCLFLSILLIFGIAVFFASCDLSSLFNGSGSDTGGNGPIAPPDPGTGPIDPNDPPVAPNQTPFPIDYTIANMTQTAGNVTAVTITPNSGKSPGAVSNIRYNGNPTVPQTAGYYPVTFDVAAATGWNAASGLPAGTLIVTLPGGGNPPVVGGNQTSDGFI